MSRLPPAVAQLLARAGRDVGVGQLEVSRAPAVLHTVLGSCVSVCLYDPEARVGGMNHILLSGRAPGGAPERAGRYAADAVDALMDAVLRLGGRRSRLQAKLFGGAHVLPGVDPAHAPGERNARFVQARLEAEGVPLRAFDVGGFEARRVYFVPTSGEAFVRRVSASCLAVSPTLGPVLADGRLPPPTGPKRPS